MWWMRIPSRLFLNSVEGVAELRVCNFCSKTQTWPDFILLLFAKIFRVEMLVCHAV